MTSAVGRPLPGGPGHGDHWSSAIALVASALDRLGRDRADAGAILTERGRSLPEGPDPSAGQAVSANGSCRLLHCGDGLLAVNLPRPDDLELLPAWLGTGAATAAMAVGPADADGAVPWGVIASALADLGLADAVGRGQELGLAVAAVPATGPADVDEQLRARATADPRRPFLRSQLGRPAPPRDISDLLVVDLSSLWAGPLCSRLLAEAGADVCKVESTTRPDGARHGDPLLFERLHAGKRFVSVPFATGDAGAALRSLLSEADVIIEGSRPRALERLGIDPAAVVAARPGVTWLSITAYGRTGPWRDRVGFGDDTAAAAGLLDGPAGGRLRFVGDAIADPMTGVVGAALVLDAVAAGGGVMLDLSLREVTRSAAAGAGVQW